MIRANTGTVWALAINAIAADSCVSVTLTHIQANEAAPAAAFAAMAVISLALGVWNGSRIIAALRSPTP